MCLSGDANLTAHQVFDVGADGSHRAGSGHRGRCGLDRGHEQYLSLVSVVHDRPTAEPHRSRPTNRPSAPSGRQLPLHFWRLAGVAGVLPINVPSGIEMKKQADPNRFAGTRSGFLRDEFNLCMSFRSLTRGVPCQRGGRSKRIYPESRHQQQRVSEMPKQHTCLTICGPVGLQGAYGERCCWF